MEAQEFIKDLQMVRGLLDGFYEWNIQPLLGKIDSNTVIGSKVKVTTCTKSRMLQDEIVITGKILDLLADELSKGDDDKSEEVPFSMRHLSEIKDDLETFITNNEVSQKVTAFGKDRWETLPLGEDDETKKQFLAYVSDPKNIDVLLNGQTKVREIYYRNNFREFNLPDCLLRFDLEKDKYPSYEKKSVAKEGMPNLLLDLLFVIRRVNNTPAIPTPLGNFYYQNLISHLLTIYSLLSAIQELTDEKQSGTNRSGSAISPKELIGKNS